MIHAYQFAPGDLVLVRNSRIEASLDRKTKPRWIGPMVIVRQMTHGAYILTEMDGAVSKLRFAAFRVIPYHARRRMNIDLEYSPMPMKRWKMRKMRWRRMRISKRQQIWRRKYRLMMKRITHDEYRPLPQYHRQINGFRRIPPIPKNIQKIPYASITFRFTFPFHFSVLFLCFISLFLSSTKLQLSCARPPWVSRP
jgi:hypothetical protein